MGRPCHFARLGWSPDEVDRRCQEYLATRTDDDPPTVHGLRYDLQIYEDSIWGRYAGNGSEGQAATGAAINGETTADQTEEMAAAAYRGAIKRALQAIHGWMAKRLLTSTTPTGAIFVAKATLGWHDQPEIDATGAQTIILQIGGLRDRSQDGQR